MFISTLQRNKRVIYRYADELPDSQELWTKNDRSCADYQDLPEVIHTLHPNPSDL
jgi:hypothetical protein